MSTDIDPQQRQRRSSSITTIGSTTSSNGNSSNATATSFDLPGSSPRTGDTSAPVANLSYQREPHSHLQRMVSPRISLLEAAGSPSLSSISTSATNSNSTGNGRASPLVLPPSSVHALRVPSPRGMHIARRLRRMEGTSLGSVASDDSNMKKSSSTVSTAQTTASSKSSSSTTLSPRNTCVRSSLAGGAIMMSDQQAKLNQCAQAASNAMAVNDSMVYLDGPRVYACQNCRTHLTSHDDIISKSFHGRHGRAYLFDECVNVTIGPAEDRMLITGLHSVCDIFCKRCQKCVGWTYQKAYEASQKYKEGKYIIEKINLFLEESDYYDVEPPAGERQDRWRKRSISWGSESCSSLGPHDRHQHRHHHHHHHHHYQDQPMSPGGRSAISMIYEYRPLEDGSMSSSSPSLPL